LKRPAAVKKDNFHKTHRSGFRPGAFCCSAGFGGAALSLGAGKSRRSNKDPCAAVSLTLDEPDTMAQASRAGIGLAYAGEWLVADDG